LLKPALKRSLFFMQAAFDALRNEERQQHGDTFDIAVKKLDRLGEITVKMTRSVKATVTMILARQNILQKGRAQFTA